MVKHLHLLACGYTLQKVAIKAYFSDSFFVGLVNICSWQPKRVEQLKKTGIMMSIGLQFQLCGKKKSLLRFMRSPLSNQTPVVSVKEAIANQCRTRFSAVRENWESTRSILLLLLFFFSLSPDIPFLTILYLLEQLDGLVVVEMSS